MKRFTIFVLLSVTAAALRAQSVTQAEAMQRASRYYNEHVRPAGLRSTAEAEPAAVTPWMAGDTTCMYAVQMDGGGWVLVSADDRTTVSVLAYSENGTFDTDDMPDGMRWLLGDYADQIMRVKRDSTIVTSAATPGLRSNQPANSGTGSERYTPGEWLLNLKGEGEILWNQNWYDGDEINFASEGDSCSRAYNYFCPSYGLRSSKADCYCQKAPAGCGPVAMGQIMRYWKWPLMTAVPTSVGGDPQEIRNYEWSLMPVSVTHESSIEDAQRVSLLLRDIGYAANATYRVDGTSSSKENIVKAFERFSYHAVCTKVSGDWSSTVRNEIDQGRPVIYGGYKQSGGGHWFVVDGYNKGTPNMFHINWGWAGSCNCECVLSELAPDGDKDEDGNQVVYSENHEIIYEIYPICSVAEKTKLTGTSTGDVSFSAKSVEVMIQNPSSSLTIYADEVTLLPGTEVSLGASMNIITPSYQYCQTKGPGKK